MTWPGRLIDARRLTPNFPAPSGLMKVTVLPVRDPALPESRPRASPVRSQPAPDGGVEGLHSASVELLRAPRVRPVAPPAPRARTPEPPAGPASGAETAA